MKRRRMRFVVAPVALPLALAATVMVAFGYWSAPGTGVATASSASLSAATISVSALPFNSVTVTWTQQASLVPSSAANSSITYSLERQLGSGSFAAIASGGCAPGKPYGTTSCVDTVPASGSYTYRVVATYRTWTATSADAGPVSVTVDTAAPSNAIALSNVTGGAFKSGATVYYRGAAAGSFTLTNALTDSGASGPASSATAALSGTSTGWAHTPSTVSTPAGGPYVSNAFSWSAAASSSPTETVTGSDVAGNTAATALTFTDDSVAPSGGTVDATGLGGTGGRYSTSTALSIAFTPGTDSAAGLATSGAQLLRASATLSSGTCGTFGGYTQVGSDDPSSPVANTVPSNNTCYRYQYTVLDRVGNLATYTSPDIKVDTTPAAAPTAVSVTSGGNVKSGTSCGVTANTRFINSAGMAAVGVSATIPSLETGESVVFSATTPGSTPVTTTVAAIGTTLATLDLSSLLDGAVTLTARTQDAAGNLSTTLGPTNTVIKDIVAGALSGLSYNDRILQADQILGTSECGATIVAVKQGGSTYTLSAVGAGGTFTLNVQAQALSSYHYDVTATDLAGNTSAIIVVSGSAFL